MLRSLLRWREIVASGGSSCESECDISRLPMVADETRGCTDLPSQLSLADERAHACNFDFWLESSSLLEVPSLVEASGPNQPLICDSFWPGRGPWEQCILHFDDGFSPTRHRCRNIARCRRVNTGVADRLTATAAGGSAKRAHAAGHQVVVRGLAADASCWSRISTTLRPGRR